MSPSSKRLEITPFAIFVIGMAAGLTAAFRAPDVHETVLSVGLGAFALLLAAVVLQSTNRQAVP